MNTLLMVGLYGLAFLAAARTSDGDGARFAGHMIVFAILASLVYLALLLSAMFPMTP